MAVKRQMKAVFLIALLCFTFSMTSSALSVDTHSLPRAAESRIIGGGQCDDALNGAAVGMGIASLLGCFFCPVGAIAAKAAQMFFC
jgi:hypothetical protein